MNYDEVMSIIRGHYFDLVVCETMTEEQLGRLRIDLGRIESYITQAEIARRAERDGTKILHDTIDEERARANAAEKERDAYLEMICRSRPCSLCEKYDGSWKSECVKCATSTEEYNPKFKLKEG